MSENVRYTLGISVENEEQRDFILKGLMSDLYIPKVGVIRAVSRDDLFKENEIYSSCFSGEAIEKLKAMACLDERLLSELQWQIELAIDRYIQGLKQEETM